MQRHASIPIVLAVALLAGLGIFAKYRIGTTELEKNMSAAFSVGPMVDGKFNSIATLTFDEAGAGTLEIIDEVAEAGKLRAAWEETAAQEKLKVRRTRRVKDANGNTISETISVIVERGGDGYPQGVIDYLSNKYGYFAQPAN